MKLPCKDCICLAICRSCYLNPETLDLDPLVSIACKCKLLHYYMFDSPNSSDEMTNNENTFVKYMKDNTNG